MYLKVPVSIKGDSDNEYGYNYRELLKTGKDGKKYLVFLEFLETPLVTKVAVAYQIQNDLKNDTYKAMAISFGDLYKACKHRSSTYLEGRFMGMKVAIYQHPPCSPTSSYWTVTRFLHLLRLTPTFPL